MTVKDLITLLQQQDPDALVIKYNDGDTTATSDLEGLSQVAVKPGDQATILIE